ncbi:flagellar basal-body rod protein FlgF [Hwanghaeella sp.]|uniref:flagellar basal-body rod protein FlgF n=1 Tax=Hwanghaeella sp. TaxID=2605943 RepID=UPI003CCBDC24
MENSVYIAMSRQATLEREMDITANNLANVNTPSYKAEKLVFREFLMDTQRRAPGLSYVQDLGQYRVLDEGPIRQTGNPLDVAISGDGYFVVDTELGDRYTRHGRFQLDADGTLITGTGEPVQGEAGPIVIPPGETDLSISGDGVISGNNGQLGQLRIVRFENPEELRRAANGMFTAQEDPVDVANPKIIQGSLEDSNVEAVLELTNMMRISRDHQRVKKFLDQEDRRMRDMIDKLTRATA